MTDQINQFIDRWGVRKDALKHDLLVKVLRPVFNELTLRYCENRRSTMDSESAYNKAILELETELGKLLK